MSGWNGSGVFIRVYSWTADAAAGIDISSTRTDTDTDNITANGFGNCLTRDGQGSATANLPMNTFRHTNVGNGVAQTDYAALGQVLGGSINWGVASGTSDAITAGYTPAVTVALDGQLCCFRASAANATSTPTFTPNSGTVTAQTITKLGGLALSPADIPGNLAEVMLRYNLANTRWELLNPAGSVRTAVSDAAYTAKITDRIIAYTAISTARAIALPAASAFPVGVTLLAIDESGSCSKTNTISFTRAGGDTINGGTSASASAPYGYVGLESNGSNAWTIADQDLTSAFGTLPTSLPGSAGLLWNNGGVVSIS